MRKLFGILSVVCLIAGCAESPTMVSSAEYEEWSRSEECTLHREREMDDIVFSVSYIPKEELALREAGENATPEEWKKALEAKGDMNYFKLVYSLSGSNQDILKHNLYDETEYYSRTNYLAFGVDKDVYVQCGKDRIPCRLHQYTPHYGISPNAEVLFAFDKIDSTRDVTFVLEDQLFGSGILQFEFTADDLKNIPTIQF